DCLSRFVRTSSLLITPSLEPGLPRRSVAADPATGRARSSTSGPRRVGGAIWPARLVVRVRTSADRAEPDDRESSSPDAHTLRLPRVLPRRRRVRTLWRAPAGDVTR